MEDHDMPSADEQLALRESALSEREERVRKMERRLNALETLDKLRLPREWMNKLDFDSDKGLESGLTLAREAAKWMKLKEEALPPPPRVSTKERRPLSACYSDRAALYHNDEDEYRMLYGGKKLG